MKRLQLSSAVLVVSTLSVKIGSVEAAPELATTSSEFVVVVKIEQGSIHCYVLILMFSTAYVRFLYLVYVNHNNILYEM